MDDNDSTKGSTYYQIPANVINKGKFLSIHWTHWLETFILAFLFFTILFKIPFMQKPKIIITIVGITAIFFFGLRGIKGRTLTEFLILAHKQKKKRTEYHLGGIHEDRKSADIQFAGESWYDQATRYIERTIDRLDSRYISNQEKDSNKTGTSNTKE